MVALVNLTNRWYTLEADKEADTNSAFEITRLKPIRMAEVSDYAHINEDGVGTIKPSGLVLAAKFGVVGWRGVVDDNGVELAFNRSLLDKLSFQVLCELGLEVIAHNTLTDEEKKTLS